MTPSRLSTLIGHDAQEPRTQRRLSATVGAPPPRTQTCILHRIRSVLPVKKHPCGEPKRGIKKRPQLGFELPGLELRIEWGRIDRSPG